MNRPTPVPEFVPALEAAWPGVRMLRLEWWVYRPGPADPIAWREMTGELTVFIGLSGPPAALLAAGLITEAELEALPPSGVKSFGRLAVSRGRRTTRLQCHLREASGEAERPDHPAVIRLRDRLAEAIARLVWQPPQRAGA